MTPAVRMRIINHVVDRARAERARVLNELLRHALDATTQRLRSAAAAVAETARSMSNPSSTQPAERTGRQNNGEGQSQLLLDVGR